MINLFKILFYAKCNRVCVPTTQSSTYRLLYFEEIISDTNNKTNHITKINPLMGNPSAQLVSNKQQAKDQNLKQNSLPKISLHLALEYPTPLSGQQKKGLVTCHIRAGKKPA